MTFFFIINIIYNKKYYIELKYIKYQLYNVYLVYFVQT